MSALSTNEKRVIALLDMGRIVPYGEIVAIAGTLDNARQLICRLRKRSYPVQTVHGIGYAVLSKLPPTARVT